MEALPASPARHPKTRYFLVAIAVALLALLAVTGFVRANNTYVSLVVDGEVSRFTTDAEDVAAALAEAGVAVSDADIVSPALDEPVVDDMTLTVRHAVPVTLVLAGDPLEIDVVGSTVADVLTCAGLDPDSGIEIEPTIDTEIEPGMTISATDVFLRVVEEEVQIPFDTETVDDDEMASGARTVRTEGVPGRMVRIYEVVVTAGSEGARVLKAERVVEQPVDEVVAFGTKRVTRQVASRGSARSVPPAPQTGTKMTVNSSAYTPGVGCGTNTATGARAGYGIVAVDPTVIPLGTRMYIPGYGYGVAADTGGAIKGNKIDVCFDTLAEAYAWGRRTVTITIVD